MGRERIRISGRAFLAVVLFLSILTGCSWRPDRNAAEANLKAVERLGANLEKYIAADATLDADGKRIKRGTIHRAKKLAKKLVEVSQ